MKNNLLSSQFHVFKQREILTSVELLSRAEEVDLPGKSVCHKANFSSTMPKVADLRTDLPT